MRSRIAGWLACIVVLLIASGCASQKTLQGEANLRQAARYNVQLGANYLRENDLQKANDKLEKALEQDPELADAHHVYAILQERLGQNGKAEEHYRKAIELADSGKASDAHNNYGSFLCKLGRIDDAEEQYRKAVENPLYSRPEVTLTNAGSCALRKPDEAAAERFFREALERNPEYRPALYEMAKLSYDRGRYLQTRAYIQRYEAVLTKMASRNPQIPTTTPEILWLCIQAERAMGNGIAAQTCAERLIATFPESREATQLMESERYGRGGN